MPRGLARALVTLAVPGIVAGAYLLTTGKTDFVSGGPASSVWVGFGLLLGCSVGVLACMRPAMRGVSLSQGARAASVLIGFPLFLSGLLLLQWASQHRQTEVDNVSPIAWVGFGLTLGATILLFAIKLPEQSNSAPRISVRARSPRRYPWLPGVAVPGGVVRLLLPGLPVVLLEIENSRRLNRFMLLVGIPLLLCLCAISLVALQVGIDLWIGDLESPSVAFDRVWNFSHGFSIAAIGGAVVTLVQVQIFVRHIGQRLQARRP